MSARLRTTHTLALTLAVLLCCWWIASPAGAASTCSPGINTPGTLAPGTVVAPGLRVLSTNWTLGNCPSAMTVAARSADGTLWVTDTNNNLYKSTDDFRSVQLAYTATGYVKVGAVVPLSSGTILISVKNSSGSWFVLRSTDSTGTSFSSTPVISLPSTSDVLDHSGWTQIGNAIYIGQYGAGPPVNLWKSTNDGQSFQVVWQGTDVDEIHDVQADPYVPGRLWIALDGSEIGNNSSSRVGYSDDGGQTFTWIPTGAYPQNRTLALMFEPNAVYYGCDCPDIPGALYRYDRQSGQVSTVMSNLQGPFYDAVGYQGQYAQFSAVEPQDTHSDQYIHILSNGDGTTWSETRTPWTRSTQNVSSAFTDPVGATGPDSQGRFWVSFYNLSGSAGFQSNFEFQFDPSAKYNGVSSSFTFSPNPITTGQTVNFDGSGSSSPAPPLSYLWNFGDGNTASTQTASDTYSSPGPFTASLQVNDANNDAALSTETVSATPQAPTTSTGGATVTTSGATLYGEVNPNNAPTTAYFQYGTTTSYGSQTPTQNISAGTQSQPLNATISGLQPSTTYHYRLVSGNNTGNTQGLDQTFTTGPVPTSASTGTASSVAGSSATLNGSVTPNGFATTVHFDYGTTTAYGNSTAAQSVGSGSSAQAVATPVTGLQGTTTYHFRIVAVNQSGTYYGADQTFTTTPPPPAATTNAATYATAAGATLNATVNPNGADTMVHFDYGTTSSYGASTAAQDIGSGTAAQSLSTVIAGLQSNTTYHFRVVASNQWGTTAGSDMTLTTSGGAPVATTTAVSGIGATSATANGTIDPQGLTTTAYFQYGTSTSYGSQTANQTLPGNLMPNPSFEGGNTNGWSLGGSVTPTTFQAQTGWASQGSYACRFTTGTIPSGGFSEIDANPYIQGITGATTYNVSADLNILSLASGQQVVLYVTFRNSSGSSLGKIQVAATRAAGLITLSGAQTAPTGTTQAQVDVTVQGAGVADLYFDNVKLLAAGTGTVQPVSAPLSGLSANTTYHYRVVATSSAGTTFGSDQTFTTGGPPSASTSAASGVTNTAATLNGSVNPNELATSVYFDYGTTSSYGTSTPAQSIGSGTTAVPVSAGISGLSGGTVYHYRVVAINSAGTTDGPDLTFTTPLPPSSSASAPAYSDSSTWKVGYSASPSQGGPPIAEVDLYAEGPGQSTYTKVASDTSGSGSGTFNFTASAGDGTYSFYTVATDQGGDVQPAPSSGQASTQLDTVAPSSTASSPSYSTASSWNVTYTAADNNGGSGLARVDLYAQAPGQSSYTLVASSVGSAGSGSFTYTPSGGDGTYSFYTLASDNAGNVQAAPSSPQATTVRDSSPPTSTASAPAYSNSQTWTVSYTTGQSSSGISEVDLYAQAPGQSGYAKVASDTSGSGSGSFTYTASAGDGTYSFYTVATNNAGVTQTTPSGAQTTTQLDTVAPSSSATSPALSSSTTISVPWTASDNNGGSGLQRVDLYVQAPGQSGYTLVASDPSGNASGAFSYTASAGDGTYSFYTLATDNAGNSQAAPSSAQTTTQLDTTAPTSTASSPSVTNSSSISVSYTASDGSGSGVARVDLYAQAPGQSGYAKVASDTSGSGSGSFTYTASAGDGTYSFYTLATDKAGNAQATPSSAQTTTQLDTAAPSSSATSPALSSSTTISVSWTASDNAGGSGLQRVDLYAQAPGQSGYTKVASDTSGSGSGSFTYTASAGDGTYGFYTVATDKAGNAQATPSSAQTTTQLDTTAPTSSASSPSLTNSSSISVSYTASDGSGSGVARVDLYAQAPGQSGYTEVASDTSGSGAGSFTYTASAGDGTYSFYTLATDKAGNAQATPSSAQTTTQLDTTAPSSNASSPSSTTSSTWSVSYSASDNAGGSGLARVDLYAEAPGQSSYSKVASNTSGAGSGSFSYTASAGTGAYNFYTLATDKAGNVQSAPAGPQTTTTLSTLPTSTTVAAPASDGTGGAIAGSSISSTLSGAGSGAGGMITFKVFGPQASAPASCTTGGTTVGTATVSGNGTYHPSAGFTPASPGTYWWYASYGGDSGDSASSSTCGAGMTATTVSNAATTTTVAAPGTGLTGDAIAASSISSTLSGAGSGAGGTITFKVFGPQASAPASCTSGGTTVGTATVSGSGTYHPSAGFTPASPGTYWWYASYSGDSSTKGSSSSCGSGMPQTATYSMQSVASATDASKNSNITTSSFTIKPSTTYLLLISRTSGTGDSVSSISSSGFSPAVSAFTKVGEVNYNKNNWQWAYYVTTPSTESGNGTFTISFGVKGPLSIVDLVQLGGNSTSAPIVTGNVGTAFGNNNLATANLPNPPASTDAGLVFLSSQQDLGGTAPAATPAMSNIFYSHQAPGTAGVYKAGQAQQQESLGLGANHNWGTIALEIKRG